MPKLNPLPHRGGRQIARRNGSQEASTSREICPVAPSYEGHVLVGRAIAIAVELDLDSLHICHHPRPACFLHFPRQPGCHPPATGTVESVSTKLVGSEQ